MAVEQATTSGRASEPRRGWAGAVVDGSSTAPLRQWEGGAAPGIDRHFRASRRRWRLRIASFFVLVLALIAAYLILLLHFPQRTPLVVAAAYQYDWPLMPNAWTREDLANLRRLDGQTVELLDASLAWKSRQHILADWDRTLAKIARRRSDTRSAVFYLSLHGVVAEDGVPYLLPPKSSPFDREQWVSVRELLERAIRTLPKELNVLVILDCNRQLDNWNAGLVHNTFALRLSELVADLDAPNLAVLNSTSEGETAWSSSEIRGSVFGRAVLLGLAGAADRKRSAPASSPAWGDSSDSARDELGGDADGVVSARELERFVAREVKRWSRAQRHSPQTPRLLPDKAADFSVAWTLHPTTLAKIEQELSSFPAAADSVTAEELAALWSSFDALRELRLERYDPVLWHDLEHQLMWLERLAASGEGYGEATNATHRLLRERLESAVRAAAQVKARPTLAGQLSVLAESRVAWPRTLPVASYALSENLGLLDAEQGEAIESALRASATGDAEPIPEGDNPPRERVERLSEVHLQQLARVYRLRELWTDVGLAQEMTNERLRFERLVAQLDFRAIPLLQPSLLDADQQRRFAEDQFLAGEAAAAADPASTLRSAFDQLAGQPNSPANMLDRAWAVRDRALAELPYWARWMAGQWRRTPAKTSSAGAGTASSTRSSATTEATTESSSESPEAPALTGVKTENAANPPASSDPAQIIELVVAAVSLADALDAAATAGAGDSLREISPLAQQLEQRLEDLRRDYLARCAEMDKDPFATGDGLRNLEDALELPFLPSEQRLNLRRALGRTARDLHAKSADAVGSTKAAGDSQVGATGAAAPSAADTAGVTEAQRLANWRVHPLMSILWSEEERRAMEREVSPATIEGKSELAAHLERTSHRLRLRLLEIAASSRGLGRGIPLPSAVKTNSDGTTVEEAVDSQDLLQRSPARRIQLSERRTRLAAAVWLPPATDDAIQARRRYDLQRFLLWQAERALEDSWGAGPRDPLIAAPTKPFFERAVADYLRACEMIGPVESTLAAELDRIRGKLARRSSAFVNWAAIRSRRDETAAAENQVNYLTTIAAQRAESPPSSGGREVPELSQQTAAAFPQGLATVALRTLDRRPVGARAITPMPLAAQETVVMLAAPAVESGLEAVLIFRGNEVPEAVDDRLATGVVVDVRPVFAREARVTLFGDRRQRSSVVFILDCSGSMAREIAVEATGPSTLPRLELAKSSLQSLLDQLAPRGEARVGVRFFGHRVGFSTEKPVKVLRQEAYPAPIPDDLHPGEDVELFLPLGRFDSVEAGRVARRLESLQAWGQSPLYRALLQARSDFDAEPEDTNKSVVVITDGENYQFAGNDPTLRAPQATTANDVRAAFGERKIPIYILGFGLSETEDRATEREFSELAKSTQGEYFSVQNGRDLLKVLRTRLGVGTYSLRDNVGATMEAPRGPPTDPSVADVASSNSSTSNAAPRETRLNLPIIVPGLGDGVKPFAVRFESAQATLQLEGGEAVSLRTSPDGRDIMAIPYEEGLPVSDSLSSAGHRERFTLRAHRPMLAGRVARFRVSLQDEDLRFTARPAEVWIEIKPVIDEETGDPQTYVFYDRYFAPNEPVPVIDCTANNWPAAARRAEVRAWCKQAPTPPVYQLPAPELLKEVERFAEPRTVSGVDGFQFRASIHEATAMTASAANSSGETGNGSPPMAWELRVVTQVADQGPDVAGLRVAWQGERAASPIRVVHRYEPTRRQAIHSFWFPVTTSREVLARSTASLAFTTRQASRNGAFRTANDRPLIVEVSGADGTLQLDAATGPR